MDFVKIKENIFVIIIGILFVGALAAAIVGFINKQHASDLIGGTQSYIIDSFSKSVGTKYMDRHTIYNAFEKKLKDQTLGKYSISVDKGVVYAASASGGMVEAEDESKPLITSNTYGINDNIKPEDNELYPMLVPYGTLTDEQKKVDGTNTWKSWYIEKDKLTTYSGSTVVTEDVSSKIKPAAKGFVTNGFFGFVGFKDKSEAEDFQDKFMPNSFVVKVDSSKYGVVMPFGQ